MIRAILAATILIGLTGASALAQQASWKSGASGGDAGGFASWRGTPLGLATGWAPWDNWGNMLSYMGGSNPRTLRSRSQNVSIGLGLFPQNGGNLEDCAAGRYADDHRSIGSRLAANGLGDAELRLGWEANNGSYPWTAVGRSATQWKACFASAARALKAGGQDLRIAWHMAKKGKVDVRTLWPDEAAAVITNVGVSHFDDAQALLGLETSNGSPWGLRAWLRFAQEKGKRLELAEWGGGRRGDNASYIQNMHEFFREVGDRLAHEGYLNGREHQLYPNTRLPSSAARYRELF